MAGPDFAGLRTWARRSPKTVDLLLVGLCALVWLVLLGFSVAAAVALVDLGRGFHEPTENPHTGLLYIVIGISALIILVAIPVLLRVRQAVPAQRPTGFPARGGATAPTRPGQRAGQTRRAVAAPPTVSHDDAVDRILLRATAELASAIGAALIAVAVATYLMTVGRDTGAWVGYGVAGLVTAAMPVIPWLHVRELHDRIL
ncbi:MAG TPA: DUF2561 family protein [Mycobacterium sp.]|nr:DUF2561 family protein [Mycobacterium sp.]